MTMKTLVFAGALLATVADAERCQSAETPHACDCGDGGTDAILGYEVGPTAGPNYDSCFAGYGTLEWAVDKCNSEPTCTTLHDFGSDDANWRACWSVDAGTHAATYTKTGTAPYNDLWGKVGTLDDTLYRCDSIACYSYDSALGQWLLLPAVPTNLTLQRIGSSVESSTHYLSSSLQGTTLTSKACGAQAAAAQSNEETVTLGDPDATPEPTASPTVAPTAAPTMSLQLELDAWCQATTGSPYARRDLGVLSDLTHTGQNDYVWRCYSENELDFSKTGKENCVDNCGLLTSCAGAVDPIAGSVNHASRASQIAAQIVAKKSAYCPLTLPTGATGDYTYPANGGSVLGCGATKNHVEKNPAYAQHEYSSIWDNDPVGVLHGLGQIDSSQALSWKMEDSDKWMKLDLTYVAPVVGVTTQGRYNHVQWITSFWVDYSVDNVNWTPVEGGRRFLGNSDPSTHRHTIFRDVVQARYIRIHPVTWHGHPSIRAGVKVQNSVANCDTQAAIDNVAQSDLYGQEVYIRAVDNYGGLECAQRRLAIDVDMGQSRVFNHAKIYMYAGDARSYCGLRLDVSDDGVDWTTMIDRGNHWTGTSSNGNQLDLLTDVEGLKQVGFAFSPVKARYLRFWSGHNTINRGVHLLDVSAWYH